MSDAGDGADGADGAAGIEATSRLLHQLQIDDANMVLTTESELAFDDGLLNDSGRGGGGNGARPTEADAADVEADESEDEATRRCIYERDAEVKDLCIQNNISITNFSKRSQYSKIGKLEMFFFQFKPEKNVLPLHYFPSLMSLSIIAQDLRDLNGGIGLEAAPMLQHLWICETEITEIAGLSRNTHLVSLHLYSNKIKRISGLENLKKLEKLWLSDNQISAIENIEHLTRLTELNIGNNFVTRIGNSLDKNRALQSLNVSGNLLSSFTDIGNLRRLPRLRELWTNDPDYAKSPLSQLFNSQTNIIYQICLVPHGMSHSSSLPSIGSSSSLSSSATSSSSPSFAIGSHKSKMADIRHTSEYSPLKYLDALEITQDCKDIIMATFAKKRMFYASRIRNVKRNHVWLKTLLQNEHSRQFHLVCQEISHLLYRRGKMEKVIEEYTTYGDFIPEHNQITFMNAKADMKEIDVDVVAKSNLLENLASTTNDTLPHLDLQADMCQRQILAELETCGNLSFDEGKQSDSWYVGCVNLMTGMSASSVTSQKICVHRILKVHNRFLRNIFERRFFNESVENSRSSFDYVVYIDLESTPTLSMNIAKAGFSVVSSSARSRNQWSSTIDNSEYVDFPQYYDQNGERRPIAVTNHVNPDLLKVPEGSKKRQLFTAVIAKLVIGTSAASHASVSNIAAHILKKSQPNKPGCLPKTLAEYTVQRHELLLPEYVVEFELVPTQTTAGPRPEETQPLPYLADLVIDASRAGKLMDTQMTEWFSRILAIERDRENAVVLEISKEAHFLGRVHHSKLFSQRCLASVEQREREGCTLAEWTKLVWLDQRTSLSHEAIQERFSELMTLTAIRYLNLSNCGLTHIDARQLLTPLPLLDTLVLSFNRLTGTAALELLLMLLVGHLVDLSDLRDAHGSLSDAHKHDFLSSSPICPRLQRVHLDHNLIRSLRPPNFANPLSSAYHISPDKLKKLHGLFLQFQKARGAQKAHQASSSSSSSLHISLRSMIVLKQLNLAGNLLADIKDLEFLCWFLPDLMDVDVRFNPVVLHACHVGFLKTRLHRVERINTILVPKKAITGDSNGLLSCLSDVKEGLMLKSRSSDQKVPPWSLNLRSDRSSSIQRDRQQMTTMEAAADSIVHTIGPLQLHGGWIERITTLELEDCHLWDIDWLPEQMHNLRWASFRRNHLTSVSRLVKFPQLEELCLDDNHLSTLGDDLPLELQKLRHLEVNNNTLVRLIPVGCGDSVPASSGSESYHDSASSTHRGHHGHHVLHRGKKQQANGKPFKSLTYLSVEGNFIKELVQFSKLTSLTELYVGNNQLSDMNTVNALKDIPRLVIFDFLGNAMANSDDTVLFSIFHLPQVKILNGTGVTPKEQTIARERFLGKLTYELLAEKIGKSSLKVISNLDLRQLKLREIVCFMSREPEDFRNLVTLNLDNNSLTNIDGILSLRKLTSLSLNSNKIENLFSKELIAALYTASKNKANSSSSPASSTSSLQDVSQSQHQQTRQALLKNNSGSGKTISAEHSLLSMLGIADPDILLPELTSIHLGHNHVSKFADLHLTKFPSLNTLHLHANSIVKLAGLEAAPLLQELILDKNKVKMVDRGDEHVFPSLINLRELHMRDNRLRTLKHFTGMIRLEKLFVNNNRLQELTDLESLTLPALKELQLVGNPCTRKTLYRYFAIIYLPSLSVIDSKEVTREERDRAKVYQEEQMISREDVIKRTEISLPNIASSSGILAGRKVPIKVSSVQFDGVSLDKLRSGSFDSSSGSIHGSGLSNISLSLSGSSSLLGRNGGMGGNPSR